MKNKTIKTPNFERKTAKIIAEIRNRTCIDDVDAEAINEILQESLNEYLMMLDGYYEEEYYIAVSRAKNSAYDKGHSDGYADGYDDGYDDGRSAV